jgi:hypothetical protein
MHLKENDETTTDTYSHIQSADVEDHDLTCSLVRSEQSRCLSAAVEIDRGLYIS